MIQIMVVSRLKDETIFWNDRVLNHRHIDPSRHYRFELEEGTGVRDRGIKYKNMDIVRVYVDQNLIYNASFCRVHSLAMPKSNREDTVEAESLPRGFDTVKAQRF
jgi:hypothetical protein